MTRRTVFGYMGGGVALAAGAADSQSETEFGRVRGALVRGVHIYRGIPYGGPTEGAARFLPSSKPAKWAGVRDCTITGPRCVQGEGNLFLSPLIGAYFGGGRPDRVELAKQVDSENCLNLNVLTPGLRGKRPVLVYMHGGGLSSGSSILTLFGDGLPREQDVVVVGVNHRLNVFGYTYLGGLSPKYAVGNVGQLDLIAALQWVHGNIAQFGGDPANVTIYGESGGGAKISALLAMPGGKGLYHKATVQSGSSLRADTPDKATESARNLLAKLGLTVNQVDELQKIPADKLLAAGRSPGLGGNVVVDGHSIPQQTWDPKAPEVSASIPMIIGNDKDESTLFSMKDEELYSLDQATLRARVVKSGIAEADVDSLLGLYRRDHPSDTPTDIWFRLSTDRGARRNATRQAELKVEQGKANVFMYYCQWNTPIADGKKKVQAFHTSDLPLTMRLVLYPESEQLSRQLSGAWAAFARTGNPSQKGLAWPAYTLAKRETLVFDGKKSEAVNDPDKDERQMLRTRPSGSLL
ncbi:MAG: carboxylesterase family protein [Bryobacteraceae bacterium]